MVAIPALLERQPIGARSLTLPQLSKGFPVATSNPGLDANAAYIFPARQSPQMSLLEQKSLSTIHSPASLRNGEGSGYLTPPLVGSESESPPYKPDENDFTSLDMHKVTRKLQKRPKVRRSDRSMASASSGVSVVSVKSDTSLDLSSCGQDHNGQLAKSSAKSFENIASQKKSGLGALSFPNGSSSRHTDSSPQLQDGDNQRSSREIGANETACSSLPTSERTTRLVKSVKRCWSLIEDGVHLNSSTDAASTSEGSKESRDLKLPSLAPKLEGNGTSFEPSVKHKITKPRRERQGNKPLQSELPETPATITLRKASKKYDCNISLLSAQNLRKREENNTKRNETSVWRDGDPLTSSHDHRKQSLQIQLPWCEIPEEDASSTQESKVAYGTISRQPTTPKGRSPVSFLRKGAELADMALTLSEVFTTSTAASLARKDSRKHSKLAIDLLCRSSSLPRRSDGSVHEIIWEKDDSPSSLSSVEGALLAGAVLPDSGSDNSPDSKFASSSPPPVASAGISRNSTLKTTDTEVSSSDLLLQPSPELLSWSWENPQSVKTVAADPVTSVIEEPAVAGKPEYLRSKKGRYSKGWRDYSTASILESFPPLLDRQSTSDWRVISVPTPSDARRNSLNETCGLEESPILSRSSTGGAIDEQPRPRLQSSDKRTRRSTLKRSGQAGSAIGSSSKSRIPSIVPYPRLSITDFTPSVASTVSRIRQRLSQGHLFSEVPSLNKRGSKSEEPAPT